MPSGCCGKGCRSRPFLRIDSIFCTNRPRGERPPTGRFEALGAVALPSRMILNRTGTPVGDAAVRPGSPTTWAVAGATGGRQWITRWGVHSA
jgi:hypothetical protein